MVKSTPVKGSKETASQGATPLGANVEEASVPEIMGKEEPERETTTEKRPAREYVAFKDAMHFEERRMSPQDWTKVGVQDAPEIVWDSRNKFRVPRKQFDFLDDDQFERFILADPRLELVTE